MNLLLTKDQKEANPSHALTFKYLSELKEGEEFWITAQDNSMRFSAVYFPFYKEVTQRVIVIDQ